MKKTIVLVGHCGADAAYLKMAVSGAAREASVVGVDDESNLTKLVESGADLLLVNRQLDYGFETDEGVQLIANLRRKHPRLKMMLVSNFPEAQQAAALVGALPGFGKSEIGSAKVKELLRSALAGDS
jgi:DNA-binding NarL/FixJ family response regulator